ncbi:MAG TPA: DUF4287 domain-containing protein [Candidatus Acidoferrales bacterium]|nr:DUF4287 domain-containing protein [Candidatus Acidoferrales bacterium]
MKKPRETKRSSDESVMASTGRVWAEWFKILDKAGAKKMAHQDISAFLRDKHGVGPWWGQMVAVAYERERGLRQKFQKCDGEFSASSSRTLAVPLAKAYAAWTDEKLRERWLPHAPMEITTATPGKSLRAKWNGGTRLSVNFYGRGPGKAQVAVDHMKLASSRECAKMKTFWFAALNRLESLLT